MRKFFFFIVLWYPAPLTKVSFDRNLWKSDDLENYDCWETDSWSCVDRYNTIIAVLISQSSRANGQQFQSDRRYLNFLKNMCLCLQCVYAHSPKELKKNPYANKKPSLRTVGSSGGLPAESPSTPVSYQSHLFLTALLPSNGLFHQLWPQYLSSAWAIDKALIFIHIVLYKAEMLHTEMKNME